MLNSYSIEELIKSLGLVFPGIELSHKQVSLNDGCIHTFFVNAKDDKILKECWRPASNFLALNFQNSLQSEFERWNMYLFFLIKKSESKDLKYQIENDTFSSRKIIVENTTDMDSIISDHILNSSLTDERNFPKANEDDFKPNQQVWDLLKGKTLKRVKRTNEATIVFEELVDAMKNKK